MAVLSAELLPVVRVLGLTALSLLVSGAVAVAFRWYARSRLPLGVSLLAGVSAVALYLNTQGALGQVVAGQTGYLVWEAVLFNSLAFLLGGLVTPVGRLAGDRLALAVMAMAGARELEGEVSGFVRTVGRLTAVTLPEAIDDIPGYDPAGEDVKAALAGTTLLFPRRVTVDELRTRLRGRIKDDYDVGFVDVEVTAEGEVTYFALGRRVAGIGPTLGPGAAAVAVEADPPNAAGPGDVVQLWTDDGGWRRVATAEVRGVADDVVTVVLDEQEARTLAGGRYRLVTLPAAPDDEKAFAGLLRAAEETMAAIRIAEGSDLEATTVGGVGATVVAVKAAGEPIEPIPARSRPLAVGDLVYVVAKPASIRQLEAAAGGPHESTDGS